MKKVIYSIITLIICMGSAWGNGGSYLNSTYIGTGQVKFTNLKSIDLQKERLFIYIEDEYANVRVEYTYTNEGEEELVDFAFPVDCLDEAAASRPPEYKIFMGKERNYLKYTFFDKKISSINMEKTYPKEYRKKIRDEEMSSPPKDMGVRRWYISKIKFKANAVTRLTIIYRVYMYSSSFGTSKDAFSYHSPSEFSYFFKPAVSWGDGIIEDFEAVIDINPAIHRGGKGKINLVYDGKKIPQYGGVCVLKQTNFNVSKADLLTIHLKMHEPLLYRHIMKNRVMPLQFKVSSTLAGDKTNTYSKTNMFDGDIDTAWVEGKKGYGIGEWIYITIKPQALWWVGMLNGYTKSEFHYYANSRIKKCLVEYKRPGDKEWKEGYEGSFIKDLPYSKINRKAPVNMLTTLMDGGEMGLGEV